MEESTKRTRKGRLPRLRRAHRKARATLARYRRLVYAAGAAAVLMAGALAYFIYENVQPEPVLLGVGHAGVQVPALAPTPAPPLLTPAPEPVSPPDTVPPPEPAPPADPVPAESGEASYYGNELAGQPTASGEPFDPAKLTAAHRTLPLGSRVRVTNTRNGESVVVRVNDRGPFHHRRVIDLSHAAARQIGLLRSGTAPVRLELLR